MKRILIALAALSLLACQGNPDKPTRPASPTPQQLVERQLSLPIDAKVTWGGVVQGVGHDGQFSLIEITAYPLGANEQPDLDAKPQGNFVVMMHTFVDPADLKPQTAVTVAGLYRGLHDAQLNGRTLRYAKLGGEKMRVWDDLKPSGQRPSSDVRWHLGIGSGGRGGVGVGIGF